MVSTDVAWGFHRYAKTVLRIQPDQRIFLSLGVTNGDSAFASFRGLLAGRAPRYDEGKWVVHPKGIHFFRLFSSRDLVFLDDKHRVIGIIEGFPPFGFAPMSAEVASVLALPVRTISSSQTQSGNQLVICVAEELEFRLRRMPDLDKYELMDSVPAVDDAQLPKKWMTSIPTDRRAADANAGPAWSPMTRQAEPWKSVA